MNGVMMEVNSLPEGEVKTFKFKGLVKQANSVFVAITPQQRSSERTAKRKGLQSPRQLSSKSTSNRRKPKTTTTTQEKRVDYGKASKKGNKLAKKKSELEIAGAEDPAQTGNVNNTYERLMLSLGSPLPNEHELALGACLRLSAVGDKVPEEVNLIGKNPAILRMLLAHAGFYEDCGMRAMMEDVFLEGFGMSFAGFWKQLCGNDEQLQGLLCECYQGELTKLSEEEIKIWFGGKLGGDGDQTGRMNGAESLKCCGGCQYVPALEKMESFSPEMPFTLGRSSGHFSEKLEERVQLVGTILSNLSFQSEDAIVMARSPTMIRFLLLMAQMEHPKLSGIAFDIISNISRYMGAYKDNSKDGKTAEYQQLVTLLVNLMMTAVLSSPDRFKIARGLEALEGIVKGEDNQLKTIVTGRPLFSRILELLTLDQDLLLVAACLDCLHTMSEIGKESCEDIAQTRGSISTLISYLTWEFSGSKYAVENKEEFIAETMIPHESDIIELPQAYEDNEKDPRIITHMPLFLPGILVGGLNGTIQVVAHQTSQTSVGSHHEIIASNGLPNAMNSNNGIKKVGPLNLRQHLHHVTSNVVQPQELKAVRKMLKVNINGNVRVVNMQLFSNGDQTFFSMDQLKKDIFPCPCLWEGCNVRTTNSEMLYWHVSHCHCPDLTDSCCRWDIYNRTLGRSESCSLPRGKLSLLTHLERCHFGKKDLEAGLQCRGTELNEKNSFQQMHSNFGSFIEKTDSAQEGDVDVAVHSVRLTAAIVLRNLSKCSSTARRALSVYESHLAEMLMRDYDCSAMVGKILHCISLGDNQEEDFKRLNCSLV